MNSVIIAIFFGGAINGKSYSVALLFGFIDARYTNEATIITLFKYQGILRSKSAETTNQTISLFVPTKD